MKRDEEDMMVCALHFFEARGKMMDDDDAVPVIFRLFEGGLVSARSVEYII